MENVHRGGGRRVPPLYDPSENQLHFTLQLQIQTLLCITSSGRISVINPRLLYSQERTHHPHQEWTLDLAAAPGLKPYVLYPISLSPYRSHLEISSPPPPPPARLQGPTQHVLQMRPPDLRWEDGRVFKRADRSSDKKYLYSRSPRLLGWGEKDVCDLSAFR